MNSKKMHLSFLRIFTAVSAAGLIQFSQTAVAQSSSGGEGLSSDDVSEVELIEQELEKGRPTKKNVEEEMPDQSTSQNPNQTLPGQDGVTAGPPPPPEENKDLSTLAPFSDVPVIQKRFLPKTKRMQLFGGLTSVMNDPWFFSYGLSIKAAYHFTEKWGVEASYSYLTTSERQSLKDLNDQHGVQAKDFVHIKGYTGLDLLWTPIYGKTTIFNKKIVPFDMYFTLGGGSTQLENGTGGSTLHVGTGQLYALSKASGVRWDLSWNSFKATPNSTTGTKAEQSFNNILLTVGFSFFIPEATYR